MLREGKTKSILDSSMNSALLAVEIYNKPRTPFKIENYIVLMTIARTRLFHAYFNNTIGDKYFYKEKNGRYKKVDGEKKGRELGTCISKYGTLNESVKKNLEFFIKLRNKIEHRHINNDELLLDLFGECQALLYNYETLLISLFGNSYTLNESLAFALQFSTIREEGQHKATKRILSKEVSKLKDFILKYRDSLSENIFNAQEYSIKLIQIPRIASNNRGDISVEFVKWSDLSEEDRNNFAKLNVIIKEKKVTIKTTKLEGGRPQYIINLVKEATNIDKFLAYDNRCLCSIFSIKPTSDEISNGIKKKEDTNEQYCYYNNIHGDYIYTKERADFIIQLIINNKINNNDWRKLYLKSTKLNISEYEQLR